MYRQPLNSLKSCSALHFGCATFFLPPRIYPDHMSCFTPVQAPEALCTLGSGSQPTSAQSAATHEVTAAAAVEQPQPHPLRLVLSLEAVTMDGAQQVSADASV